MLANVVDGVLLIVDAGHTRRETALQAVYNLQQAGANLLGFVLNSASPQARTASLTHRAEPAPVSQLTEEPAPAES
jgi:Mrp family chromosome partitioning ATPase